MDECAGPIFVGAAGRGTYRQSSHVTCGEDGPVAEVALKGRDELLQDSAVGPSAERGLVVGEDGVQTHAQVRHSETRLDRLCPYLRCEQRNAEPRSARGR